MNNLAISWIRTGVPYAVGALATWLITLGVELSPEATAGLITFLTFLLGNIYYLVARKLEQRWPQLGFLLGVPAQPQYEDKR